MDLWIVVVVEVQPEDVARRVGALEGADVDREVEVAPVEDAVLRGAQ